MVKDFTKQGLFEVLPVSHGIVRNLLRTTYYLRIPRQESDSRQRQDREGQTVQLPPGVDVKLDYRDFDVVSDQLKQLDRDNVVRIIRYPQNLPPVGVMKDGVIVVDPIRWLDFHGEVGVIMENAETAGVIIGSPTGVPIPGQVEVAFSATDWAPDNTITIIPVGAPGAGQVGPHALPVNGHTCVVSNFKTITPQKRRQVDMNAVVDFTTGFIIVHKAPAVPSFDGVFVISLTIP